MAGALSSYVQQGNRDGIGAVWEGQGGYAGHQRTAGGLMHPQTAQTDLQPVLTYSQPTDLGGPQTQPLNAYPGASQHGHHNRPLAGLAGGLGGLYTSTYQQTAQRYSVQQALLWQQQGQLTAIEQPQMASGLSGQMLLTQPDLLQALYRL